MGESCYRAARADEHGACAELIMLAFGRPVRAASYQERTRVDAFRVLERDGELVAALRYNRLAQYWLGAAVPSCQVLQMATAVGHRGRGYGAELLGAFLAEARDAGAATSTLFASTLRFYRSVGFEPAGEWACYRAHVADLPRAGDGYQVRRVGLDDVAAFRLLYDQVAPSRHGALVRDERWWDRWLRPGGPEEAEAAVRIDGPDGPAGWALLSFEVEGGTFVQPAKTITVLDWGCLPGAERALWRIFEGYDAMDAEVVWKGPSPEPVIAIFAEQAFRLEAHDRWLLRVVDVPAALTARRYPAHASGQVVLDVTDTQCAWNEGAWRLEVAAGHASVERAGSRGEGVRCGPRALGPLYTGYLRPEELVAAGLLDTASDRDLSVLGALFASPTPWTAEHY